MERIEKGKVVKIPDIAFVTWVTFSDLRDFPLTVSQIQCFHDISLHRFDRFYTIWIARESHAANGRNP